MTPARRQAPSAPSAATMVPSNLEARSRSRLLRLRRLGPAPTTIAASPEPSCAPSSSSTECLMWPSLVWALAFSKPTPATRSKVAASIARASLSPSSIRLRLVLVALPDEAFLAHEADAAAEARERLLLELVGRVRGVRLVLDDRVHVVVALEKLRHAQLLLSVRNFWGGIPMRSSSARCLAGLSNVATTMPSTSAVA